MTTLRWYGASASNSLSSTASLSGSGAVTTGGGIAGLHLRVFNISATGGLSTSAVLAGFGSIEVTEVRGGGVKLRFYKVSSVDTQRVRVYEISAGSALGPAVRWYALGAVSDPFPPSIVEFGPLTKEPQTFMSLTAVLESGSSIPDSWTWRVVSGAQVTLFNATTPTVSFTTPSQIPPDPGAPSLVLGVQAILDTVFSTEVVIPITILPGLDWTWDGTQWVGAKVTDIR